MANYTPRKNVNRERAKAKKEAEAAATQRKRLKSFADGGEPGKKKLTKPEKLMRKKKLTHSETRDVVKAEGEARSIKRQQDQLKKERKAGAHGTKNQYLI